MSEWIYLNEKVDSIRYLCQKDKRLAKLISMIGPINYQPHDNGFSFLVHEIIEQMLSIKSGQKIYSRLEALCNGCVTPDSILSLTFEQLREIGTSSSKANCLLNLSRSVNTGKLILSNLPNLPDKDVISSLTELKGIGNWTAKMYLIFVLDRPDILPYEDGAFIQSYKWLYKTTNASPAAVIKKCKKWSPYSSIAARYLYRTLDMGFTKSDFHLYKEDV